MSERTTATVKEGVNQRIDMLLGMYGAKGKILGMVIEDWVKFCEQDDGAILRYLARETNSARFESILVLREDLKAVLAGLEAEGPLNTGANLDLHDLIDRLRKELEKNAAR